MCRAGRRGRGPKTGVDQIQSVVCRNSEESRPVAVQLVAPMRTHHVGIFAPVLRLASTRVSSFGSSERRVSFFPSFSAKLGSYRFLWERKVQRKVIL